MTAVDRMVPAGVIDGQPYWVRAEVAADHPGRVWGMLDLHFLWSEAELAWAGFRRDGNDWVQVCEVAP